ncbi:GH92 family glycosyl hydrolase [Actinomyces qiguomingii]|uniref:GH92 family glycosyl hydrolase n=1 Tax=Actinomyces qiguomingii TaxID=2057800 RepID=UPI001304CF8B|nr:GH92 family glycosyl hydrolase [Actinomyces qiguomingii]
MTTSATSQAVRFAASRGPGAPPSSTAGCGLFEGEVRTYTVLAAGHVGIGLPDRPAAAGEILEVALFPQLLLQRDGVPDRASTALGIGVDNGRGGLWHLYDDDGRDLTASPPKRPPHLAATALIPEQWNLWRVSLEELPAGTSLRAVRLIAHADHGYGWIQVRVVTEVEGVGDAEDVVDYVRTTRGTHSGRGFSRGNTLPAVCMPHGMNFVTPVTNARTRRWLYRWHGDPHPRLEAVALSHQPSPWIGDRGSVQIMPYLDTPVLDPRLRSLQFRHDDEVALPDYYRVLLDGGIELEMTATARTAALRIHLPRAGGLTADQAFAGRLCTGATDVGMSLHGWAPGNELRPSHPSPPRMFFVGEIPGGIRGEPAYDDAGRVCSQAAHVALPAGTHEVRLATSFISVEQAWRNLSLESQGRSFEELRRTAHDAWRQALGALELDGATAPQREAAYTGLYRLLCYPNIAHENVAGAHSPCMAHAAVALPLEREHTDTVTGCRVLPGELYVNNGYWDTYRSSWPAYHLLMPERAGKLLNGMLQLFRDGGWMGRWTAPGFIDCMVGTDSDVIFADACAHGVEFDRETAYLSALRNAMTPAPSTEIGRRNNRAARFRDYVDSDVPEGLSWTVQNALDDAAIARWASRLARDARGEPRADLEAEAFYFANRSLRWRNLFDSHSGFLLGRHADGAWEVPPEHFNPRQWGGGYTETNGWGMAFSAVHDVDWLVNALGGPTALGRKLDAYFQDPEKAAASQRGTYGHILHEMTEARAIGMGQFAVCNQPAHHVPFMYLHSDRSDRCAEVLAEAFTHLFTGGRIGQGWPGDEDNGEFSAWWLFVAMGLYPLDVGSGEFVISAPQLPAVRWTRCDGTVLSVTREGNGNYIADVEVNGRAVDVPVLTASVLHADTEIRVRVDSKPHGWGMGARLASMPTDEYLRDKAHSGNLRSTLPGVAALVDDTAATEVVLPAGALLEIELDRPEPARVITLTGTGSTDLEVAVCLEGTWSRAVKRRLTFRWPEETRVIPLSGPSEAERRIEALRCFFPAGGSLTQLEVI